jgi:branched-chain amino acid transport system permease protein
MDLNWADVSVFVPLGLALGGIYALAGVGMVVLYRSTGVLNLAFGAIGAAGALVAWWLINEVGSPSWLAYVACVLFGGVLTVVYGVTVGRALAGREPIVKAMASLGLALIILGIAGWRAPALASMPRLLQLETSDWTFEVAGAVVNWTEVLALLMAVALTGATTVYLRATKLGTAMRALASDREISATLGVPVRRVEAVAWFGSGAVCGAAGLLLAVQLQTLDPPTLTFTAVIAALAAAMIGRLASLWGTLVGGLVIGLVQSLLTPFYGWPTMGQSLSNYRTLTPFLVAAGLLALSRHRGATARRG